MFITSWKSIPVSKSQLVKDPNYYPHMRRGYVRDSWIDYNQFIVDFDAWKKVTKNTAISLDVFPYKMEPYNDCSFFLLTAMV